MLLNSSQIPPQAFSIAPQIPRSPFLIPSEFLLDPCSIPLSLFLILLNLI